MTERVKRNTGKSDRSLFLILFLEMVLHQELIDLLTQMGGST